MKKTTKGAVAAGAAALLLAGGAGSFAAWNASTTGTDQEVTAGSMSISQEGTGTWAWAGDATGTFDPSSQKLVPGDTVTYTATYKINLVGTNLKAELAPTLDGVSGDLKPYLTVTPSSSTQTTYAEGATTATFTTQIAFDDVDDLVGATLTADLDGGSVTLEQVR